MTDTVIEETTQKTAHTRRHHVMGFWIVALSFVTVMAFATVPTPLYILYQQRDGFPTFTITIIFAAYGAGVMLALWLAGHLSDTRGRRTMLLVSLLLEALAAALFLVWKDVSGLIAARLVTGLGVGVLTAAATAHLGELRVASTGDPETAGGAIAAAGAVNIGGLGLGALAGGALAKLAPAPLITPYAVFAALLVVAFLATLTVPETVGSDRATSPYRPQSLRAPAGKIRQFTAAGAGIFASMAVLGVFTSLAPTFLAGTFHITDRLASGAITFSVFAAAALAQVVTAKAPLPRQITAAGTLIASGMAALALGATLHMPWLFITGGIAAGAGVGLLFRASTGTASSLVTPHLRGGVLAAIFLIGYVGMTIPVISAGALLLVTHQLPVLLGFTAVVVVLSVWSATRLHTVHAPKAHHRSSTP